MNLRALRLLLAAALLALAAACTAEAKAPSPDQAATPSGPRCISPLPSSPSPGSAPASGGPALPAMALQCFAGGRWTSIAELGGAPTIVNLWASWCEPCRTELPVMQRVATAGAGKVRVVGVVTKDRHDQAQSVIDDAQLTFPMLEDQGQQFAIAAGALVSKALVTLPATLFITPDGRIAYAYQGKPLDEPHLRALAAQYLGVEVAQ